MLIMLFICISVHLWVLIGCSSGLNLMKFQFQLLIFLKFCDVQFQYAPQHLVRLLQIIVDNNCDMGVRQVASIHFKNFIAKNWSPLDSGICATAALYCSW